MPAETLATILSLPPVASICVQSPGPAPHQPPTPRHPGVPKRKEAHLDVHKPLLVAITPEGVAMFLAAHVDALPAELLDRDERLVDVAVLRDQVRPQMQGKALRVQDVGRRLREVWCR